MYCIDNKKIYQIGSKISEISAKVKKKKVWKWIKYRPEGKNPWCEIIATLWPKWNVNDLGHRESNKGQDMQHILGIKTIFTVLIYVIFFDKIYLENVNIV